MEQKKHLRITVEELDEQENYITTDTYETNCLYLLTLDRLPDSDKCTAKQLVDGKESDEMKKLMLRAVQTGVKQLLAIEEDAE